VINDITTLEHLAQAIERGRGPLYLFGLFKKENIPGRWDLVVAAPWIEKDLRRGAGHIIDQLVKMMGRRALLTVGVRLLDLNQPALRAILEEVGGAELPLEIRGYDLFGLGVRHAYFLRARRPPVRHRRPARRKPTSRRRTAARV
jgi:hypothetical protein